MRPAAVTALFAAALAVACEPDLSRRPSLVDEPRVLAVRGEPPEAKPGARVAYDVLVVGPDGTHAPPRGGASWAFCATPRPPTENDAVAQACAADAVRPIGAGAQVEAKVPDDACTLFGPETSGQSGDRPQDPDATFGWYQPVRVTTEGEVAFGFERVTCRPANLSQDTALDYETRYAANANPSFALPLTTADGAAIDRVRAGARLVLRAAWPAGAAESYVAVDAATQAVVARRESMRVSWFASAGGFDADRTGRAADDTATFADDGWTAPDAAAPVVHLWAVLRDDRGGVAWTEATIAVTP